MGKEWEWVPGKEKKEIYTPIEPVWPSGKAVGW